MLRGGGAKVVVAARAHARDHASDIAVANCTAIIPDQPTNKYFGAASNIGTRIIVDIEVPKITNGDSPGV